MNFDNEKISASQLGSIILLTVLGTGILTLPRALAEAVGTDGWFLILIGGAICVGIVLFQSYIIKSFPGKGYMEIMEETLSKPVAYIIMTFFVLYFIGLNGFLVRLFAEVVKMFLLLRTPIEVIIFSVLLLAAYLARQGIEPLARLAELLLPLILIPSLILFLLSMQGSDLTNLLPVMQTSPQKIMETIPTMLFSFLGFDILLVFGLYVKRPEKIGKSASISLIGITVLYLILNLATIAKFGVNQTTHLIWPTISLFKTIEFPGLFIENVEALVMGLWVLIVFMSIAPLLLVATTLLGDIFKSRENKFFALPLLPLLYFVALAGDSLAESYALLEQFINYTGAVVVLGVPGLILIAMFIRKRIKKEGKSSV